MPTTRPSRQTLAQVPGRLLTFLRAAGQSLAIRASLAEAGYDAAEHDEGWALLHTIAGYTPGAAPTLVDHAVRDAIAVLDAWDAPNFDIIEATLARRHPEQAERVLAGLRPAEGAASILGVHRLLERLDALATGSKADRAALATLARRGYDDAERARLRALCTTAQGASPTAPSEPQAAPDESAQEDRLHAGYLWLQEWSAVARAKITRRDHLIALGLGHRKTKRAEGDDGDEGEVGEGGGGEGAQGEAAEGGRAPKP